MSETTAAVTVPGWQSLVRFDVAEEAIAELHQQYMPMTIAGLNDRKGLVAVHDARMHVKGLRVQVEKKRKELKADALEYGRIVDREAKRITALLAPIEEHLQSQEQAVLDEKALLKREEEARKAASQKIAAILKERLLQRQAALSEDVASLERTMGVNHVAEIAVMAYRGAMIPDESEALAQMVIEDLELGRSLHRRESPGLA